MSDDERKSAPASSSLGKKKKPAAAVSAAASASKPRAKPKKKLQVKDDDEGRDAEGVKSGGGVGKMVTTKKPSAKKRKKQKSAEDEGETSEDEAAPKKKKKGASSVDTSKGTLTPQEQMHEKYMGYTVDKLKHLLTVNLMALPQKPQNKDRIAWQCAYGEVMGAPPCLCPRCGHGKLKPKLNKNEFGIKEVKKGVTKWTCPGYFDEESDTLAFCNKAFTDAELHPVPWKDPDHITEQDEEATKARIRKAAEERAEARARREEEEMEETRSSSPQPEDAAGEKKQKKFSHAPRIHNKKEIDEVLTKAHDEIVHSEQEEGTDDESTHAEAESEKKSAALDADVDISAFVSDPVAASMVAAAASRAPAAAAASSSPASSSPSSSSSKSPPPSGSKPMCKYGAECYRSSQSHLDEFAHPEK